MAHFNPAVTLGFLITRHVTKLELVYYFVEILGALLGGIFVMLIIGIESNLAANSPNYTYSLPMIFWIEILASALLMADYTRGLKGHGGLAIGGIFGLAIFFFAFISGA